MLISALVYLDIIEVHFLPGSYFNKINSCDIPFLCLFLYELVTLASFSVLYVWNVYISSVLVYLEDIVLAIYYGSQIRVTTGGFELRTIK